MSVTIHFFVWCLMVKVITATDINQDIQEFLHSKDVQSIFTCNKSLDTKVLHSTLALQEPLSSKKRSNLAKLTGNNYSLFNFKLKHEELSCPRKVIQAVIDIGSCNERLANITTTMAKKFGSNNTEKKLRLLSIHFPTYFTYYGYLKQGNDFYAREQYCINSVDETKIEVLICPANCSEDICIPKHCPLDYVLGSRLRSGVVNEPGCKEASGTDVWTPSIVQSPQFRSAPVPVYYTMHLKDFKGCKRIDLRTTHSNATGRYRGQFTFEATGIKYRESGNHAWRRPPQAATIDGIFDTTTGLEMYSNGAGMEAIVLCDPDFHEIVQERQGYVKIFLVLYSLAVAIMVVIVAIYIALWDMWNIQGWIKTMFSTSLLINFILVVLDYAASLNGLEGIQSGSTGCIVLGVLRHFFGISVYSWLTVICFDLWNTITSMKPPSNRGPGYKKFFLYSLFAYGVPTVTVAVAVIIETTFDFYDDRVVRPLYGQLRCDIDQTADLYHGLPVPLTLFIASTTFGFLLAKHLYTASKLNIRKSNDGDKHQFRLFLKLFIIIGPTLIFEIISSDVATGGGKVPFIWVVLYVFNALQPYALFWVFVCNPEIRRKLLQKYPIISGLVAWMPWSSEPTTEAPSTKISSNDE